MHFQWRVVQELHVYVECFVSKIFSCGETFELLWLGRMLSPDKMGVMQSNQNYEMHIFALQFYSLNNYYSFFYNRPL